MILFRLLDLALLLVSLVIAVPALVLLVQVAAATTLRRAAPAWSAVAAPRRERFAVLIPAHNEAAGIGATLDSVLPQCTALDRVLVVADNCSDATAQVARAAGAEVIERQDPQRRGKGYALDFGVRWLERDPPEVVVIVDADCIVGAEALDRLVDRCLATGRPVQALYLMHAPTGAVLGRRIAEFAWIVKNKLRPLGSALLGWPCQLMGTGMAFPWRIIQVSSLASAHLVEDMQLGVELAAAGSPPLFCEGALVSSMFPADKGSATSQRTRWEHGHLAVIGRTGPRLLTQALSRFDGAMLAMALDLMVPPLASLVLMLLVGLSVDGVWWVLGGSIAPAAIAGAGLLFIAVGVMLAWHREGRSVVALTELMGLPLYVASKIPIYVRLFTKRQVEWVRTKRDDRSL